MSEWTFSDLTDVTLVREDADPFDDHKDSDDYDGLDDQDNHDYQ